MHKILLLCALATPLILSSAGCGSSPSAATDAPPAATALVVPQLSKDSGPRSVKLHDVRVQLAKSSALTEGSARDEEDQQRIEKQEDERARREVQSGQGDDGAQAQGAEGRPEEARAGRQGPQRQGSRAGKASRFCRLWRGRARTKNRGQYDFVWDVDESGKLDGSVLISSGKDKGLVVADAEGTIRADGSYSARVDWDKEIQQQRGTVRIDRRGHLIGQFLDSAHGENFDGGTFDLEPHERENYG